MLILQFVAVFYCYITTIVYLVECLPIEKYCKLLRKKKITFCCCCGNYCFILLFKTVLDSTQSQTELNWDKEAFGDSAEVPGVSRAYNKRIKI